MCASAETYGDTSASDPARQRRANNAASIDPTTGDVTMLTPQQQQALNVASIQAQAIANAPVDCTSIWNQLTSPACPCTYCSSYGSYVAIGLGLVLSVWLLGKIR